MRNLMYAVWSLFLMAVCGASFGAAIYCALDNSPYWGLWLLPAAWSFGFGTICVDVME